MMHASVAAAETRRAHHSSSSVCQGKAAYIMPAMMALTPIATDVRSDAKRSQKELLIPSSSLLMGDLPTMPKDRARAHGCETYCRARGSEHFLVPCENLLPTGSGARRLWGAAVSCIVLTPSTEIPSCSTPYDPDEYEEPNAREEGQRQRSCEDDIDVVPRHSLACSRNVCFPITERLGILMSAHLLLLLIELATGRVCQALR